MFIIGTGRVRGEHAADIAVERLVELERRRLGTGEADPEHRVGAEPALFGVPSSSISVRSIAQLVGGVEAGQRIEDLAVDGADRLQHAAAAVALAAVALLDRLVRPVEAPDGTAARPSAPLSSVTSTSTVGLPRLSRISRAWMSAIAVIRASGSGSPSPDAAEEGCRRAAAGG
jgi:hypothetical protein